MKFKIGNLVRWYHYSQDMIIMDGGVGVVLTIKKYNHGNFHGALVEVLCESGEIRDFEPFALDLA